MADHGDRLRNRVLGALGVLVVFRLGQALPVPGARVVARPWVNAANSGDLTHWLVDLMTGGGLFRLSVFGFGVLPCLVARILLRRAIRHSVRLSALAREGESGARVLDWYARRLAVALGFVASVAVAISVAHHGFPVSVDGGLLALAGVVVCLTAGTAVVALLADLITGLGIGDGVRVLLLTQFAAVLPTEFWSVYRATGWVSVVVGAAVLLVVVSGTIMLAQAQRRIPVQYAQRLIGRRPHGGLGSYIPVRLHHSAGPVVFAAVLLYLPVLAARVWPDAGWLRSVRSVVVAEANPVRLVVFFVLTFLCAAFRAAGALDPDGLAESLVRQGGFIPGIRPGWFTAAYLGYVLNRLAVFSALCLAVLALVPVLGLGLLGIRPSLPFGGVVLLLVLRFLVGVALDTAKQVEGMRAQRHYEGLLR